MRQLSVGTFGRFHEGLFLTLYPSGKKIVRKKLSLVGIHRYHVATEQWNGAANCFPCFHTSRCGKFQQKKILRKRQVLAENDPRQKESLRNPIVQKKAYAGTEVVNWLDKLQEWNCGSWSWDSVNSLQQVYELRAFLFGLAECFAFCRQNNWASWLWMWFFFTTQKNLKKGQYKRRQRSFMECRGLWRRGSCQFQLLCRPLDGI